MKKQVLIGIVLIALLISSSFAFAEEKVEYIGKGNELRYVDVSSVISQFAISGNNAVCKVKVDVWSSSNANKVVMTFNYIKASGESVGTKTVTAYRNGNSFTGQTSKALTSHGTYHAKVNIKVYYNLNLIESINVITGSATY